MAMHGQMRANEPGGELPLAPGLNASLTAATQHDSANGWTSLLTPTILWRFSSRFSLDATLPVFTSITTEVNTGTRRRPAYDLQTKHHAVGDLQVSGLYEHRWQAWENTAALTLGLPTGKTSYGLGAGKLTYALSDRLGYSFERVTPDFELATGNSSTVIGSGPTLPYVANATFLYVQTGATVDLPRGIDIRAEMFEMLPLSDATVYSTASTGKLAAAEEDEEDGSGEDNGLNLSATVPVASHWSVGGFYTRSLVNHYDIGGFSLTYSLRPRARKTRF